MFVPCCRCRYGAPGEPGEVHFQAGQRLRQLIMEFPRNVRAFLFLRVLQVRSRVAAFEPGALDGLEQVIACRVVAVRAVDSGEVGDRRKGVRTVSGPFFGKGS